MTRMPIQTEDIYTIIKKVEITIKGRHVVLHVRLNIKKYRHNKQLNELRVNGIAVSPAYGLHLDFVFSQQNNPNLIFKIRLG